MRTGVNPTLNAERPHLQEECRIGTAVTFTGRLRRGPGQVLYDQAPYQAARYLGSVKRQANELPDGIPYEVRISRQNGRWYASVNYWKPPVGAEEKTFTAVGAVDVGITPLAVDSELVHYENLQMHCTGCLAKLQRGQAGVPCARAYPGTAYRGLQRLAPKRKGVIECDVTAASTAATGQRRI